jgi:hypothetical protein
MADAFRVRSAEGWCIPALLLLLAICLANGCGHPSAATPAVMTSAPSADRSGPVENTEIDGSETATPLPEADPSTEAENKPPSVAVTAENPALSSVSQSAPIASQRPPADRSPKRPGEAEKITFEDLNLGLQADVVFRPFMLTDRAKELDGTSVSLAGYMHGAVASKSGIKEFVLLRNLECKFGPGGQADHLAQVILGSGVTTSFSPSPIKVEGKLKVEPFEGPDGNTWAIYRLEEARVL